MSQRTTLLLSMFCIIGIVSAQTPVIQWQNALGGAGDDVVYGGQQTTDGGYILAGNTTSSDGDVVGHHGAKDGWLVKLDATSAISWQHSVGGSSADELYAVQQTADGGYITAGRSASSDGDVSFNNGDYDAWVVKFNNLGSIVWEHSYGGVGIEAAYAITATADGGYVFVGSSTSPLVLGNHGLADFWVMKLDAAGNLQWQVQAGGSNDDFATSVVQLMDGGYLLSGYTESNDANVSGNHGLLDAWVVKLDNSGALVWQRCLGGSGYDNAYTVRQTNDGGFIMAAGSSSNDGDVSGGHSGSNDAWIVKLNALGGIEWQKMLGGSFVERAKDIQQTPDGGYIFIGDANSDDGDLSGNAGQSDIWLVKLDALGTIQWQRTMGGSSTEFGYALDQTADGGFFIAGVTDSNDGDVSGVHGNTDAWVIKLSSAGVGISEMPNTELSIGPNPCKDVLTISSIHDIGTVELSLIDATGRQVLQERMTGSKNILDLSNSPCGVYVLNMRSADRMYTERIVLE